MEAPKPSGPATGLGTRMPGAPGARQNPLDSTGRGMSPPVLSACGRVSERNRPFPPGRCAACGRLGEEMKKLQGRSMRLVKDLLRRGFLPSRNIFIYSSVS